MLMKKLDFATSLIAVLLLVEAGFSQVATGMPKFGSFAGGEFDTVDLGNLNIHFAIPILHKAGRGMPFNYSLSYDGSTWYPATVSGHLTWQSLFNYGWTAQTAVQTGYISYLITHHNCDDLSGHQSTDYIGWVYHDPWGVVHSFGIAKLSYDPYNCEFGTRSTTVATATDGSGLTLTASLSGSGPGLGSYSITTTSGQVLVPPVNLSGGTVSAASSITDANGNKITADGTGKFFDTLSGTTAVLTVAGSGTPTSPLTFTYASPAGNKQYSVNYSSYNVKTNFACSGISEYTATGVSLVSSIALPDGSQYSFTYEDTPAHAGYKTGRISTVTLPTGGTISYSYGATHGGLSCVDGSVVGVTRTLNPGGAWQYSRSGANPAWTTTVIDPSNNYTVLNFEKDTVSNNFYETQRLSYQGNTGGTLLRTDITCYNGQSVGTPASCYNTGVTTPITRVTNFAYLPNSAGLQSEIDTTYDQFGLQREVDDYDYGTGAVGSLTRKTITVYAAPGNGIVDRPSSVTIEDSGNNVKAFTAYGYDETAVSTPSGTTPQHVSVTGGRGNLTSVNSQANGTTHLYRKYTYYDTGMLKTSTDVSTSSTTDGAMTTYNYNNTGTPSPSCGNSFVTSISEPVGSMSRSFTWDCNGGVLLSVTDENSNTSSTAYSGTNYTNVFWRPYSTTDESNNTTNYFYYLDSNSHEFQTETKSATFNSGNSIVDKITTDDGLGRTVFSQTRQGPSASNYDTIATCYDSSGRVSLTTLPYSATLASSATVCPSTNPGTSYTYDALGRTLSATDAGTGSTSYSYNKNDTLETRTSPTVSKQSEFDVFGRLKSVCEISTGTASWPSGACNHNTSATGYLTSYTYDLLGNLTSVTQNNQAPAGHQTRTYVYDMLGRLTSETNPENNNASITYTYDFLTSDSACGTIASAGNLLKRLDAAGNAACYSGYDALHRVGSIIYPSSSTPAKNFVYDTATVNGVAMANAKTRLAEAYTCSGTCSSKITDLGFVYSARGEQIETWESTPHSGGYYHPTAAYWPNGAPQNVWMSLLPSISFGADGEGRTSAVSASSGQNPVTSVGYNPAGHVTAITYGSSDNDAFTFDPNTGRMTQYQFTMGATPKTDTGALTWNTNGSLQKLVVTDQINSLNSQTCNYAYDDLGRIASANCGTSIFNQNFTYDPFGNVTKTVPTGSTGTAFQPSYDYTGYTNRMTSTPFTYNGNNGALTADSSHGYAWDTANRLSTVDSGTSSGVCITYDALDRVVEEAKGSTCSTTITEVVYSPTGSKLALMNGSTLTKAFVPLPAGAQAVYNGSGLQYYRHPDWLGSSRLATTPSRTMYYDGAYAPFGENYAASGTQDLSFTGQNQDTESSVSGGAGGLYDFMFRKHSPVQGRWLAPDPAGLAAATLSDPQSWNRYAYVGNRPLSNIDPLGLILCGTDIPCCLDPIMGEPDPIDCWPVLPPLPGPIPEPPHPPVLSHYPPFQPVRHGGVWPDNETLGLPGGLNTHPLGSLGDLFGLIPGTQCGDLVQCGSLGPGGLGFADADALELGLPFCAVQPEVCVVGLGLVTVGVAGYEGYELYRHFSNNVAQNRQFDEAVRQIESRCGRKLEKADRRRLHDEITGQGFTIPEIIEIGVGMFCPGS